MSCRYKKWRLLFRALKNLVKCNLTLMCSSVCHNYSTRRLKLCTLRYGAFKGQNNNKTSKVQEKSRVPLNSKQSIMKAVARK